VSLGLADFFYIIIFFFFFFFVSYFFIFLLSGGSLLSELILSSSCPTLSAGPAVSLSILEKPELQGAQVLIR
jgi:hypothetical protein